MIVNIKTMHPAFNFLVRESLWWLTAANGILLNAAEALQIPQIVQRDEGDVKRGISMYPGIRCGIRMGFSAKP